MRSAHRMSSFLFAGLMLALVAGPAEADTGRLQVQVTKAGFIVGVGGGSGVLTFKGRQYPVTVSGLAVGATIGVSTANLRGRAYNMQVPTDLEGSYSAIGGGVAAVGGVKSVRLQNAKGVVIELAGPSIGFDFSINAGGVQVALR